MGILSLELTKEIFLFLNFSGERGEIYLATVYAAFIHSLINRVSMKVSSPSGSLWSFVAKIPLLFSIVLPSFLGAFFSAMHLAC